MSANVDTNALLLQVMAHDLLAPLTAVKWQLELLEKSKNDKEKCKKNLDGINASVQLGIALTKHAHVAAKVLTESYESDVSSGSLTDIVTKAVNELVPQYERHGLVLESDIGVEDLTRELDTALTELLVWSLTKFFLTVAPASTTVHLRGICVSQDDGPCTYMLVGDAAGIPDQEDATEMFQTLQARNAYDQTYVFVKLMHETAKLLDVTVTANSQPNLLAVELSFPRKSV